MKRETAVLRLLQAMNGLDETTILAAAPKEKMKKTSRKRHFALWAAALLVILLPAVFRQMEKIHVTDLESCENYALEEALSIEPFGVLFPEEILPGYVLEGSVGVYDKTVLEAKFYSEAFEDELTIRIAAKEWFGEVEENKIFYKTTLNVSGSYCYVSYGKLVACYTLSNRDIASVENFFQMVRSAPCFAR